MDLWGSWVWVGGLQAGVALLLVLLRGALRAWQLLCCGRASRGSRLLKR